MTTAIAIPEQLEQESHAVVTQARGMVISSVPDLESAATFLRNVKTVLKRIDETFDGPIKAAHDAHKAMLDAKKRHAAPLQDAERTVKTKMSAYQAEQERLRREEEARLRELARKQEEERMLREAEAAEAAGDNRAAEEILAAPVAPPIVVVPTAVPKIEGVKTRKVWKFRITAPAKIPRTWLVPNEQAIGAYVRQMRGDACIPGVEVYAEDSIAAAGF